MRAYAFDDARGIGGRVGGEGYLDRNLDGDVAKIAQRGQQGSRWIAQCRSVRSQRARGREHHAIGNEFRVAGGDGQSHGGKI